MSEPFWTPLGGQPVDYEGAWAAETQYAPGDVVVYNGVNYLAVNPSLGVPPPAALAAYIVPAGALVAYAGAEAPAGYLLCDGAAVSRTTYAALYAAIGTTYGTGDGSTTFNLPDLRGRVAVGKGTHANVDALGENDGSALADRQPKHRHTVNDPTHSHQYSDNRSPGGSLSVYAAATNTSTGVYSSTVAASTGITIAAAGATAPLDTPAYIVLNYIIKT